ncbi:MAG: dNTP triphosphohydrolase [Lentisphaeria bacterium]
MSMDWQTLLTRRRLGRSSDRPATDLTRNDFQRDFDRIVFASAFRRLQDKTQVFPLAESDYVRTRLTHSLEASCVGRSLGEMAAAELLRRRPELAELFHPSHLGAIVAAACLAHDIGNPPFGHTGESAIAHWFNHEPAGQAVLARIAAEGGRVADFAGFEGNAQGFRVLTRLQHGENPGGMQLTLPTLGAFMKYPRGAGTEPPAGTGKSMKKHGFFAADEASFQEVAAGLGLLRRAGPGLAFARHPLAFLVEAADDICYHVADLEDGFRLKLLAEEEVAELLAAVIAEPARRDCGGRRGAARVELLRARAIGSLVEQVAAAFVEHHDALLSGGHDEALVEGIAVAPAFARLFETALAKVYPARQVLEIEVAGFSVLGRLIELFLAALDDLAAARRSGGKVRLKTDRTLKLLPSQFFAVAEIATSSQYARTLAVTDFVSGMTDRYAVSLFKRLTGISLPGE